ncbi:MAG: ABC transporter substrate-binding protein, partial [Thermomicrobiales bacterium]
RFTYELHMDEDSNSSYTGDLVSKIAAIEVIDPLTIAFTLPQPYADFAVDVAVYGIIAEHVWADVEPADVVSDPGSTGEDPDRVVGTGPFIFQEWVTNDHATAIANENYWAGAPYLAEFIYKVVPDTVAGIQQLRTGEIDWLGGIPGASVQDLDDADVELTFSDTLSFAFYGYNLDPEHTTLFQDAAVRQALFHALDREAMVDVIRAGYSTVAAGTIPILSWAYNPEGIDNPYPYDPDLAAQLLDEAGWVEGDDGIREKDGERLAFSMHTDASDPTSVSYVTAMQEFWAQIGVEMTPQLEPFQALVERIAVTFDYETFMIGFSWGVAPDQAAMFACDSYEGGFNVMHYCNEEVDALLAAAVSEPDQATRIEIYTDYQNLLLEDLPAAILDFPQSIDGHSTRVHNLFPNAVNERFNAETWWVEE